MEQTPIRAVEMVRAIRDAICEETKGLSREELKQYFSREAAAMRQESQGVQLDSRSKRPGRGTQ